MDLDSIRKKVDKIVDKQGLPIDSNIKELVIGLMAHGINTTGSCEGHKNWGQPYPWVDVPYKHARKIAQLIARQNRPISDNGKKNKNNWVIRPSCELRIIPQNQQLPLGTMQKYAKEFGLFLQRILD